MDKKEYIASFKNSRQISIDDWEVFHPSLKITEDTTIGEIDKWYRKMLGHQVLEVTIIQLELHNQ